ncbi:MAG TPA: LysR family transcriptional regulator [Candidatus Paceibacterota bacterium]|nr:LysR family transcriptional regulator [Candidatus Paceibacterota bacterium]
MHALQPTSPAGGRFPPSLNLKSIRTRVAKLSGSDSDLLSCISDDDAKLCIMARVNRAHLEERLNTLYKRLGINLSLSSLQKRQAAAVIDRIYEREGWRPEPETEQFLIKALTSPCLGAPEPASEPQAPAPAPVVSMVSDSPLPTPQDVAARFPDLTEWKRQFLSWVVAGHTVEHMVELLHAKDGGADRSTVESHLQKLCKSLGIRIPFDDERVRALIIEAHASGDQVAAEVVDNTTPQPLVLVAAPSPTEAEPELAALAKRIAAFVSADKVTKRAIEFLDALAKYGEYAQAAHALDTTEANMSQMIKRLREQFEVPAGNSASARIRGTEERKFLIRAWQIFRAGQNAEVLTAANDEVVQETLALEPATPAEATVLESAMPQLEPEPAAPVPPPIEEPGSEELPAPPVQISTTGPSGSALRNPQDIRSVRVLWSSSASFAEDQAAAYAEGYRIERVDHVVSFEPVFACVSAVLFVKRS